MRPDTHSRTQCTTHPPGGTIPRSQLRPGGKDVFPTVDLDMYDRNVEILRKAVAQANSDGRELDALRRLAEMSRAVETAWGPGYPLAPVRPRHPGQSFFSASFSPLGPCFGQFLDRLASTAVST